MNLPPKPQLEYRERVGQFGEIIQELTPESEMEYTEYLRKKGLAEVLQRRTVVAEAALRRTVDYDAN